MRAALGAAAALLVVPALAAGAVLSGLPQAGAAGAAAAWGGGVPPAMAALYDAAAARFGVPAGLLRAVGKVESDHGRDPASAVPNAAGAVGPMQFEPGTFAEWSWASGSPAPSITDPADSVFAAAAKLAAEGAAGPDPTGALFAYNAGHADRGAADAASPAHAYAASVLSWALVYGWRPAGPGPLAGAVLRHPRIGLRAEAAGDVAAGRADPRLLAAVLMLATRHALALAGPFVTGHSLYVKGTTRVSNHALGRAVDLPVVDGAAVGPANAAARALVLDALALPADVRPDEVLSPWALSVGAAQSWTNADHQNHVHLGFRS